MQCLSCGNKKMMRSGWAWSGHNQVRRYKCGKCGTTRIDSKDRKEKTHFCPHTTNPRQLRHLCERCVLLDKLNVSVYQMPDRLGGDWAATARGVISDGFKSRQAAEKWAIEQTHGDRKPVK